VSTKKKKIDGGKFFVVEVFVTLVTFDLYDFDFVVCLDLRGADDAVLGARLPDGRAWL
jgi:hypothetical protein